MSSIQEIMQESERLRANGNMLEARQLLEQLIPKIEEEHGLRANELIAPLWSLASIYQHGQDSPSPELATSIGLGERALDLMRSSMSNDRFLASRLSVQAYRLSLQGLSEAAFAAAMDVTKLVKGTEEEVDALCEAALIALESCHRPNDAVILAREAARLEAAQVGAVDVQTHFVLLSCLREAFPISAETGASMLEFLARESRPQTGDDELKAVVRVWLEHLG